MDINHIRALLETIPATGFDLYERETGDYQLVVPIHHEDNDMLDVYLEESPFGDAYIRICDFGLTLMRLSYTFDIGTQTRKSILESILVNNRVSSEAGNLYIDVPLRELYQGILQFTGCIQKICNMRYWGRETSRSAFYSDLKNYVATDLTQFSPEANLAPLSDYPVISVDWSLTHNSRNLYLYGVGGDDKAKTVAIYLLEFKKAQLPFISFVVHEDMEELGRREKAYLTRNADKQYPDLESFRGDAVDDIRRLAGART